MQMGTDVPSDSFDGSYAPNVALSENGLRVAIGDGRDQSANAVSAALVYAYSTVTNDWIQLGQAISENQNENDLGYAVSLSADGNILAVGGRGQLPSPRIRIFQYNNVAQEWEQLGGDLTANDPAFDYDQFGSALALSSDGTKLAVGGYEFLSNGSSEPGRIEVYSYSI